MTTNHHSKAGDMYWKDYYDDDQPIIYVAGPYNAPTEMGIMDNIRKACEARDDLVVAGWAVVCPHANTANMDNENPDIYYRMDVKILARCDAIYMLHGWENSPGARMEHEMALEWGITVYYESGGVPQRRASADGLSKFA